MFVEPGLVNAQVRVDHQAIAVEALNVVAFVSAAVTPDVDPVFAHGGDQLSAGDGAAEGRGVEVWDAGRGDVEGAALEGVQPFADEFLTAIDEAGFFGAVDERLARDVVIVGLVGLAEVRGVGIREGAFLAHPVDGGAGVESAGEGDADALADGKGSENVAHA